MILDNEFTGDLRVENEVTTLQNAGHQVSIICFNYGSKKNYEEYNGAKVFRIKMSLFVKNKLKGLNNTIFNFYPIFWTIQIKKFIERNKIEALHVHDLWMLESAYRANKKFKLPVVADLHENFVHALNHYKYANTFPGNILISKERWKQSEIKWTQKASNIITVIEEAVERYKSLGVSEDKISVVANYVNLESFLASPIDETIIEEQKDYFTLTYVGGFDIHRGLESAIKAVPTIKETIPNFKLILVGRGSNFTSLQQLAAKLNVENEISFMGWQPHEKLSSYIKASNLCLIPHLKSVHTDNTIPHKLFQYMIFEKPAVTTNCNPLKRILDETKAGVVYESGNENDLAQKIIELYNNPKLCVVMGQKGKKAVLNKYNWNETSKELIALYSSIELKKDNGQ